MFENVSQIGSSSLIFQVKIPKIIQKPPPCGILEVVSHLDSTIPMGRRCEKKGGHLDANLSMHFAMFSFVNEYT